VIRKTAEAAARKGEEERSMANPPASRPQNAEHVERFRKLKAQYQGTVLQLADPESNPWSINNGAPARRESIRV